MLTQIHTARSSAVLGWLRLSRHTFGYILITSCLFYCMLSCLKSLQTLYIDFISWFLRFRRLGGLFVYILLPGPRHNSKLGLHLSILRWFVFIFLCIIPDPDSPELGAHSAVLGWLPVGDGEQVEQLAEGSAARGEQRDLLQWYVQRHQWLPGHRYCPVGSYVAI